MGIFLDTASPSLPFPSSLAVNGDEGNREEKIKKAAKDALCELLFLKMNLGSASYRRSIKWVELTANITLACICSQSEYWTLYRFMTIFCSLLAVKNYFWDLTFNFLERRKHLAQYINHVNEYNKQKDQLFVKGYDLLGVEPLETLTRAFEGGILHQGLSSAQVKFLQEFLQYYQNTHYKKALKCFLKSTGYFSVLFLSTYLAKTYGKEFLTQVQEDFKRKDFEKDLTFITCLNLSKGRSFSYKLWKKNIKDAHLKTTRQVATILITPSMWLFTLSPAINNLKQALLHVMDAQKYLKTI